MLTWPPSARIWAAAVPPAADREPAGRYEIRFQPTARRAISGRLPESVAAAVLEFCDRGKHAPVHILAIDHRAEIHHRTGRG